MDITDRSLALNSSAAILALLRTLPVVQGRLPVIFIGAGGPRCIGSANTLYEADELMMSQRLSATYVSRARVHMPSAAMPKGQMTPPFFLCHN